MANIPKPLTLAYSRIKDLEIKLDLYLPPDATGTLPVIIFFHGGGLTVGNRHDTTMSETMWLLGSFNCFICSEHRTYRSALEMAIAHGMIFISPDYHLLCPSTGLDQIADVKALFHFLSTDVNAHLAGVTLDATRIGVAGLSAGGYLIRLAALYAEPRPRAALSLFGMGGDWFLDHHLDVKSTLSRSIGYTVSQEDGAKLAKFQNMDPLVGAPDDNSDGRVDLVLWWFQNGEFIDHLVGEVGLSERLCALPVAEREAAIPANMAVLFPQLHIDSRHLPMFFIHGEKDSVVLVSESEYTHRQLQRAGVRSVLHTVPDAEHGLYIQPEGKLAPEVEDLYKQAFEFLAKEMA
jgi:acetyl esterase/lipase